MHRAERFRFPGPMTICAGACVRLRETPCPSEPGHLAPMRSELQLRACSSVLDWLGLALIDVIELGKALDGGRGLALRVDR